ATPGTYMASLSLEKEGIIAPLDGPVSFEVRPIRDGVLEGVNYATFNNYFESVKTLLNESAAYEDALSMADKKLAMFETALYRTNTDPQAILSLITEAKKALAGLRKQIDGSPSKNIIGERNPASWQDHLSVAMRGMGTTYGPTPLHKQSLQIAAELLENMKAAIKDVAQEKVPAIEAALIKAGAPYMSGQGIE
ncbi:glycosyl hydrolase, partial [Flavobacteriaceae bacterium]|nr:glycosyl hydrolase [Flavobacteriaceae bacterium]